MKKSPIGELSLIHQVRRRAQANGLRSGRDISLGIGDDCALIRPRAGEEIAITTDFSLETVHFRRDWHPAESVGHRCLARGLSDLAAMGARPIGALLSLALPPELTTPNADLSSWISRFLDGFLGLASAHKVPLIGGDTAQSPANPGGPKKGGLLCADVILLGGIERGRALRRSGAKVGDLIYVTGALGGAAAELLALQADPGSFRTFTTAATPGAHPHLYPAPRIAVGRKLLGLATSAIDLSDGLSTDLRHICEESGLRAEIHSIPLHPLAPAASAAGRTPSALDLALNGGEDYELLFTASPRTTIPATLAGVPIRIIGEMKPRRRGTPTIQMLLGPPHAQSTRRGRPKLVPVEPGGWEHFRSS